MLLNPGRARVRVRSLLAVAFAVAALSCGGDKGEGDPGGQGPVRGPSRDAVGSDRETSDPPDSGGDSGDVIVVDPDALGGSDAGPVICTPGATSCFDLQTAEQCNTAGTVNERVACDAGTACVVDRCVTVACTPRSRECVDRTAFRQCSELGESWGDAETCTDGRYCDGGVCRDQGCLPQVMFAIDGSSSMARQWPAIQASIASVITANPDVAFGLSMFPVGLGCRIGDGERDFLGAPPVDWPHVAIQPNSGPVIDAWFNANNAAGGATPLVSTIEWFAENAASVWGEFPENGYLIVMSEGADTCRCRDQGTACMVTNLSAATTDLLATGVRTYVIGYLYNDAPEALNAIAENGGTPVDAFIFAGSESTLTAAFESVIDDAKLCN